jgi:hypothetical protein
VERTNMSTKSYGAMVKSMRKLLSLLALAACLTLPAFARAQSTYVKVADEWGTIQPGGPRIAANGNRFWNTQGAFDGSANISSGTLRFYMSGLKAQLDADFPGGWQIDNVTLVAEHDDGGFTAAGGVSVFHFTNDELAITNGQDSYFPNPPPDAPPGNFGPEGLMLTHSPLVFDDAGMSGGQPVRVLLDDFVTPADMGTVTRVNDYMFAAQGDDNLDVLGTPGSLVNPAGATNVTPNYNLSFPTANADDSLATFTTEVTADAGDWIPAGLDAMIADIVSGEDALSLIFAATDAASTVAATYKGNAFNNRFPPRLYIQASGMGGGLTGDYNGDGSVDAADYVVWRKRDGSPGEYEDWRENFGSSSGGGGLGNASAVPEPASVIAVVLGLVSVGLLCRPAQR